MVVVVVMKVMVIMIDCMSCEFRDDDREDDQEL